MPKIRAVHPSFWTDEDLVELSAFARLLFLGLTNHACDNGHLEDRPKQIKMRVLPADDVDVDALLDELARAGLIHRSNGWIHGLNIRRHNRLDPRYFSTCRRDGCVPPEEAGPRRSRKKSGLPAGHTQGAQRAHSEPPRVPTTGGDGDGGGETAAAAAVPARSSSSSSSTIQLDDLPGELVVLRSKMTAFTLLQDVSFAHLKPDQAAEIVALVRTYGDDRLVENARAAGQPAGTVQGYLRRWRDLKGPRAVPDTSPRCPTCNRTQSACQAANASLPEADRCPPFTATRSAS